MPLLLLGVGLLGAGGLGFYLGTSSNKYIWFAIFVAILYGLYSFGLIKFGS